jgi:Phage terminase, small subunit
MKLTDKQKRFVNEYLIDLNATQAAIRAGYSVKTADVIGLQLLRKTTVQEALQRRQRDREVRTEITQDKIVNALAKIAFSDPRKVMTWGPNGVVLKDSASLTDDDAAMVAEVAETNTGLRLKTNDRMKALELLGKHLGMFTDKVEHSGSISNPFDGLTTEQLRKLAESG